jgi:uncharacterized protein (DUF305 family)
VSDAVTTTATEAPEATAPEAPTRRRGVPFLPAIFIGAALLFLGVAVTDWWKDREDTPNAVDIGFADDMSTHHLQAIRMANLYQEHGEESDLVARAQEIVFFQAGDVRVMQNAMSRWNESGSPDTAMEWMGESYPQDGQPGMATPEEMEQLANARGRELDDLFTALMIDHHAGAIHMAEYASEHGRVEEITELAAAMARYQQREIDELNVARRALGLPIHEPDVS